MIMREIILLRLYDLFLSLSHTHTHTLSLSPNFLPFHHSPLSPKLGLLPPTLFSLSLKIVFKEADNNMAGSAVPLSSKHGLVYFCMGHHLGNVKIENENEKKREMEVGQERGRKERGRMSRRPRRNKRKEKKKERKKEKIPREGWDSDIFFVKKIRFGAQWTDFSFFHRESQISLPFCMSRSTSPPTPPWPATTSAPRRLDPPAPPRVLYPLVPVPLRSHSLPLALRVGMAKPPALPPHPPVAACACFPPACLLRPQKTLGR